MKTQKTDASVTEFVANVEHKTRRADSETLLDLMGDITGAEPAMWGDAIIGFGSRTLVYADGSERDWFEVGFSPRKASMSLYIMTGFDSYDGIMDRLGKHKTGKSCLYINKLADVDMDVLRELIESSVAHLRA